MIENEILSSVYSEEMYNEVDFLEVKDFQDPTNQMLWRFLSEAKGDTIEMFARLAVPERQQYANAVQKACLGVAMIRVAQMGLKLVEIRYRNLLNILLDDLIGRSQSVVEKHYLTEIKHAIPKNDILLLAEGVSEYFEDKAREEATTYAKERLRDFNNYVNKRNQKIKLVKDGNK